MRRRTGAPAARTLAALTLCAAGAVDAHDTWLSEDLGARASTSVAFRLTSGERFARAETSIKPERVEVAECRAGAERATLAERSPAASWLRLAGALPSRALWQCAVLLAPRPIELSPAKIGEYLADIRATGAVRRQWSELAKGNGGRWREVYRKQAKTYVDLDRSGERRRWDEPFGLPLEIVPEQDPTDLHNGSRLSVRVLKEGLPLPGLPVGLTRDGGNDDRFRVTDADGRVEFGLPRAGLYLLHATELRRVERGDADWESDFTTLTLRATLIR